MHCTILACLCALLAACPAVAQSLADFERVDGNQDGFVAQNEFEEARRRDFDLLDNNKDGFLSRDEFLRQRGADATTVRLRERRFDELDANRDRRISRDEYLAYGRSLFTLLDRDRDRRISRAEFEAALAGRAAPPPSDRPARGPGVRPPPTHDGGEAFARFDRNRDGGIGPDELDAMRLEAFQRMDRNGDGRLAQDEIVATHGSGAVSRFTEMDRDKDGFVTRREFLEAGRAAFRAADANSDGRLSREEFARNPAR